MQFKFSVEKFRRESDVEFTKKEREPLLEESKAQSESTSIHRLRGVQKQGSMRLRLLGSQMDVLAFSENKSTSDKDRHES